MFMCPMAWEGLVIIGDSWFGCYMICVALLKHVCFMVAIVKTGHRHFLEAKLKGLVKIKVILTT